MKKEIQNNNWCKPVNSYRGKVCWNLHFACQMVVLSPVHMWTINPTQIRIVRKVSLQVVLSQHVSCFMISCLSYFQSQWKQRTEIHNTFHYKITLSSWIYWAYSKLLSNCPSGMGGMCPQNMTFNAIVCMAQVLLHRNQGLRSFRFFSPFFFFLSSS